MSVSKVNLGKISAGDVIHIDGKGALGLVLKTMLSDRNISSFDIIPILKHPSSYTGQNSDRSTMMPNDVKTQLGLSLDNQYEIQIQPSVISSETLIGDDGKITRQGTLAESSLFNGTLEKLYAHLDKELETGGDARRIITRISRKTAPHRLEITKSEPGGIYDIDLTDASEKHDLIQIETARILKLAGISRLVTARDIAKDKENPHHLKQIYDLADNPAIDFEAFKSDIIQGTQRFLLEALDNPVLYQSKKIKFKFPEKEIVTFKFKAVDQVLPEETLKIDEPKPVQQPEHEIITAPELVTKVSDVPPKLISGVTLAKAAVYFAHSDTYSILKGAKVKMFDDAFRMASQKGLKELKAAFGMASFPLITVTMLKDDILNAASVIYPDREIK